MLMTEVILTPSNGNHNEQQSRGVPATNSRNLRVPPNSAVKRFDAEDFGPFLIQKETTNTPKVCSIHPGKSLELSTTIGLAKYRNSAGVTSSTSPRLKSSFESTLLDDTFSGGSMFTQHRGQLKSGRLRPLSLHYEPQLTSDACLGILPVKAERTSSQHYRSLTAPTMRHAQMARNNGYPSKNRRSYSAAMDSGSLISSAMSVGKQLKSTPLTDSPLPSHNNAAEYTSFPPVIQTQETISNHATSNYDLITIKIQEKPQCSITEENTHIDSNLNTQDTTVQDTTYLTQQKIEDSLHTMTTVQQSTATQLVIDLTPRELPQHKRHQYIDNIPTSRKVFSGRRRVKAGGKLSFGWTRPTHSFSPVIGSLPPITDSKKIRL